MSLSRCKDGVHVHRRGERFDIREAGFFEEPVGFLFCAGVDVPVEDALEEAEIVVAAGRGIGEEENLSLVHSLAGVFRKGTVGCSKPICDLKWLPYSRQVGATGKIISPKLYLAAGISGSQQHLSGIKGAKWVIAINRDKNAVIFSVADFGIVEDLTTFIPILIEKIRLRTE